MHFHIRHTTHYRFSAPATLGPHTIRLRPQAAPGLKVTRWSLQVQPHPVGSAEMLDDAGNLVHVVWFAGSTTDLTLLTSFEAQVTCLNPFGYVVTDPATQVLPAAYQDPTLLAPYLKPIERAGAVVRLAAKLAREVSGATLPFVCRATEHLAAFTKVVRETGAPKRPSETLTEETGACRDLAVLLMELCRCQGLAARFVSGYWRGSRASERRYLHAWVEIYLPGAGWRGFDPSSGLAVADDHISVATAPSPEGAAPVSGTYGGGDIQARLDWNLRVDVRL